MKLTLEIKPTKKVWLVIVGVLAIILIALLAYLHNANANPLPDSIKKQVSFKVIYPGSSAIISSPAYQYQSDQKILSYVTKYNGVPVTFQEQPAPPNLGSDSQIYYPVIGIHPYAQFSVSLGTVALTKFYQAGNLKPFGQSAVLATHGTLVIANSGHPLTNEQWKSLFESLKITK